jgi:hypothetical protein
MVIKTKTYSKNGIDYKILNYDKTILCNDDMLSKLYRSIVLSSPDNKILTFSPSKSTDFDAFKEKYPELNDSIFVNEIIEGTMINLFYDSIAVGNKLEIGKEKGPSGKSSLDQYKEFMEKMAKRFDYEHVITDTTKLSDIGNKRDSEACKGKPDAILIPASETEKVYGYVKQLFTIQLQHSAKCGAIFKLLFDYQYDPRTKLTRMSLSDNVIKKGIPEIDRINYLTRQILIDYYSNCELTYINGMNVILGSKSDTQPQEQGQPQVKGQPLPATQVTKTIHAAPGIPRAQTV